MTYIAVDFFCQDILFRADNEANLHRVILAWFEKNELSNVAVRVFRVEDEVGDTRSFQETP